MSTPHFKLQTSPILKGVGPNSLELARSQSFLKFAVWSLKLTILSAFALFAAACSAKAEGPPEIVVDRTACSHCTMLISEVAYAAAYQAPGADARVFDDIACMLEGLQRDGVGRESGTDLRVWFHDAGDGRWIDGETAVFVVSPEIKTPMGGGIIAYRDLAGAEQAAARHHGKVVRSLSELMNRRGEEE